VNAIRNDEMQQVERKRKLVVFEEMLRELESEGENLSFRFEG